MLAPAMTYLPEQEQLLAYLREKGTNAEAEGLVAAARAAFAQFHEAFAAVPAGLRLVEPFPGRWSPQQILDHVVECHRVAPGQLGRVIQGLPGNQPIRAYVQSAAPYAHAWRAMLKEFRAIHDEVVAAAERLAELPMPSVGAPVELVVRHEVAGRMREHEWREMLDWKAYVYALRGHALQHVKQLERTLKELEG